MRLFSLILVVCLGLALGGGALTGATAEDLSPSLRAESLVASARLEFGAGRFDQAVQLFHEARELRPDWLIPAQWLALTYQTAGEKELALQEYAALQRAGLGPGPTGRVNPEDTVEEVLALEALVLWLVNETRAEQGLPLLRPESRLSLVAREHSLEMRDLGYFAHESPVAERATALERFRSVFLFYPRVVAENLARRWGRRPCLDAERITATHLELLDSPAHRENLLSPEAEVVGVGLATNTARAYWLTQVFAALGNGRGS